jgi:cytochrome c-type biogenesis protein CcmH
MQDNRQEAQDIYGFSDPKKQVLFNKVIHELRCSVCQNQALADSTVPFALDLKREIFKQISHDASERQTIDFVVARYGQFVLYEPPLEASTALLWLGPLLMLVCGIGWLIRYFSPKYVAKHQI